MCAQSANSPTATSSAKPPAKPMAIMLADRNGLKLDDGSIVFAFERTTMMESDAQNRSTFCCQYSRAMFLPSLACLAVQGFDKVLSLPDLLCASLFGAKLGLLEPAN